MIIKTQQTRDGFFYIGLPSVERKKERIVTFDETRKRVVRRDLLFFFFPLSSSPPPPRFCLSVDVSQRRKIQSWLPVYSFVWRVELSVSLVFEAFESGKLSRFTIGVLQTYTSNFEVEKTLIVTSRILMEFGHTRVVVFNRTQIRKGVIVCVPSPLENQHKSSTLACYSLLFSLLKCTPLQFRLRRQSPSLVIINDTNLDRTDNQFDCKWIFITRHRYKIV